MQKYNSFTLIKEVAPRIRPNGVKRRMALFVCDCGSEGIRDLYAISRGHNKMCNECANKLRGAKLKHGLIKHPLYGKWQDMKNRCYNRNVDRYYCYGGRGISVCDEWINNFKSFYDWCMLNGWKKGLSIERENVNGNYEPSNCSLIPISDQQYNKRNTFYVDYNGAKYSLSKVLRDNGLLKKYGAIWKNIKDGKRDFDYYVDKLNIKV